MPNRIDPTTYQPNLSPGWVYGIECKPYIKIGVAKNLAARLDTMRLHNPHPCIVIFKRKTVAPYHFERKMHEILQHQAVGREWFSTTLDEIKVAAKVAGEHARTVWQRLVREECEWEARRGHEARQRITDILVEVGIGNPSQPDSRSLGVPVRG